MKRPLRILGRVALVLLVVGGYAAYRIVWGQPFTINQLANRQALFFLVKNPEIFTSVGIADGTIFDRHSGRLAAVRCALRCVASIINCSGLPPFAASAAKILLNTPMRLQRMNRL